MPQKYTFIFIYKLYNLKKIVIFAPKTKKQYYMLIKTVDYIILL